MGQNKILLNLYCDVIKLIKMFRVISFHRSRWSSGFFQRCSYSSNKDGQRSSLLSMINTNKEPSSVFKPVHVSPQSGEHGRIGEEIAGKINRPALLKELNKFYLKPEIKELSNEHGLDDYLYHQAYVSFRKYCLEIDKLPPDLYILLSDILKGYTVEDLFPFFLKHARKVFPHLECIGDLKNIGDLTDPTKWYPEARNINRKIIFHAGPTNSGKTYHALQRLFSAKSGVYCGPLKLLAVEVCNKANDNGTPCDLVTGEERRFADSEENLSSHVACTVEMTSLSQVVEVAVIDEIQMLKDLQRGWAWTRAILGVPAEEIHVCGEAAAIDLVRELMISTGEEVEVRNYKRLTDLVVEDKALDKLDNVLPGDCIVCFSKQDIYRVSRDLEQMGIDSAVIYGSLPPSTKLAMAAKFNDANDPCKVLVSTDAIGMGLNLNIRRIIFYSMTKIQLLENGDKEMDTISVSQTLQIAGRAGRFNTQWETGYVTTFREEELKVLKELMVQNPPELLQAGLHPTFEQIEMYAYHLPHATLSNIVDIFISLAEVDEGLYSLCNLDDFKFLADMIGHIKLPLKAMYTFCCAPINRRMPFVCTMFLKYTRQFSQGEVITFDWLCHQIGWPISPPKTILELVHLEAIHDVFDTYLWLFYRFPEMFPDAEIIRSVQEELDRVIEEGVSDIVRLLRNAETEVSSHINRALEEDDFVAKQRRNNFQNQKVQNAKSSMERKLSDELVSQGLLTPNLLKSLKNEWESDASMKKKRK
ncbi:ATP-dependent RNA helicase SUV3 homolog, mitochondrial [Lepeophtheirus salmonis]|uniref:ATP-dependent RNA helicase SUV3 homolog, mitochondrial n=1 Tax=Lepeophtheirus salmonis TaxID=72036 RepID=UPI001AE44401|nr:ATP-dependent RNA helicase SUV3 homolog, mitochondrial-like [Lepeophtheirus salmonis]